MIQLRCKFVSVLEDEGDYAMKKHLTCRIVALLVALLSIFSLAACQINGAQPLVVAQGEFSENFSPYYAMSVADANVMELTQINMLTTDRLGGIVYDAIDGATVPYNGTDYTYTGPCNISVDYDEAKDIATYTIGLKPGVHFSDGVEATADDIIFTYYVYADPSYVGPITLSSYHIIGLENYQTQTSDEVFTKYQTMAEAMQAAGDMHVWAASDAWTEAQQSDYWALVKSAWMQDLQDIVDLCAASYPDYIKDLGKTQEELAANDGLKVALGMYAWTFAAPGEGGALVGAYTGKSWDLTTTYPTLDDLYAEAYAKYAGDAAAFYATEAADPAATSTVSQAQADFVAAEAAKDPAAANGVPNIAGIQKIDNYTVTVQTEGYEAPAIYTICGLPITPMHYYGDAAQYNYEQNQFGHPFGDLSLMQAKTTQPMGAGPYQFVKYENRVCYFTANENYYKGKPTTRQVQFKETADSEIVSGLVSGAVDIGDLNSSKSSFEEIMGYNANHEISGDVIQTAKADFLGYGYIGISAANVLVGTDPASEQSRDLRKAIATVLAVYRETAVDSYFGEAASVIDYPISNTSWAAPQKTDEGYRAAFSRDVNGNDIYTPGMTADERYAAALHAAIGFFQAAGYPYDEATGQLTAAPEGAKLVYEAQIAANGVGDHPSLAVLTDATAALSSIGFTLKINDLSDAALLTDMLNAGTAEIWCAGWQATIDPDLYQTYHSSGIVGRGGSDSNYYNIDDATLDGLIVDARKSDDQAYRRMIYRQCLDRIADWAVELPVYQRQNCTVFSAKRLDTSTITPDITTFWGWTKQIESIRMK